MRFSNYDLVDIFDRTDGDCHLCGRRLALANYGCFGARGAWEVEHSNPRATGGTNRRNNLYPACISCNRSKRDGSTRAHRARYGRTAAPYGRAKRETLRQRNATISATVVGYAAHKAGLSPFQTVLVALIGGYAGHEIEPDPQRPR